MNRRETVAALLAFGATAGTLCSPVQAQASSPYRIALLSDFAAGMEPLLQLLTETLGKAGRIEGRDFVYYRSGILYGRDIDLAIRRAVDSKPDLIFSNNLGYAIGAHKLTKTIPIVMWISGFPVEGGVAASLARPGKNVTGLTIYAGAEVFGKLVQLLLEAKPGIKRIGALCTYLPPFNPQEEAEAIIAEMRNAGRALGVDVRILEIAKPEQVADAMAAIASERMEALLLTSGVSIAVRRQDILQFALQRRLPTITDWDWSETKAAPLLCYAASPAVLIRQAADYVKRILWEGAKPGELPIQLPAKVDLQVNLKTAKAIGLTLPQSLLLRADKVIE